MMMMTMIMMMMMIMIMMMMMVMMTMTMMTMMLTMLELSLREETVPVQVLARGQEAVTAFLAAQNLGTLPLYNGRVCVLGQEGSVSPLLVTNSICSKLCSYEPQKRFLPYIYMF